MVDGEDNANDVYEDPQEVDDVMSERTLCTEWITEFFGSFRSRKVSNFTWPELRSYTSTYKLGCC